MCDFGKISLVVELDRNSLRFEDLVGSVEVT